MTVAELISLLQGYPPDQQVVMGGANGGYAPVAAPDRVEIAPDYFLLPRLERGVPLLSYLTNDGYDQHAGAEDFKPGFNRNWQAPSEPLIDAVRLAAIQYPRRANPPRTEEDEDRVLEQDLQNWLRTP